MTRKTLPIPESNRSQQGSGDNDRLSTDDTSPVKEQNASTRTGRQANIKINTTHQGHHQDR
ncbi:MULTISPECIES: hypothetical protein [Agrobacterium]|jgi:hypothetical protein|uniref:Uncharacterized protein n=2 Tax=Agrobacterium tumefaciens complex TaxID=1183400 RepID=A0AAW8M0L4_AGRTU|nr:MULTISPECIES: hypothetical protein [Agrobacterium]KWT75330.1 hypothetical protein ASH09_18525 [Agrobacterium radiobacter]MCP2138009.1 hypothetical protein [Rhizobium sp. SLBN-94]KAB0459134.1 hypothetical protein F7R04_15075 [Agrobacterium tumefaciens]MBB4409388.1 hypothetical protein [Agrobacterium radiobacter]MBB4454103.1 hypothetical protein [Agrobacterium radiobacter]